MHQAGEREYEAIERGKHAQRRQCVGIGAAEQNIDIHQAVAHDGIRQTERHQDKRKDREFQVVVGNGPQREWHGIEQRERENAAAHAVAQPLELLADHGVLGLAITDGERDPAGEVRRNYRNQPDPVEHPTHFLEGDGGADRAHRKGGIGGGNQQRGKVQERYEPIPLEPTQALRERHREVEKHSGGEQTRADVRIIHCLVEKRELPGVVRTEKDEREQAQHIEV